MASPAPIPANERLKRRREWTAIALLVALFLGLTLLEFRFTQLSSTLPFVNSIFFFGLLNVNLILLIAIVWLVSRNIGKLILERRRGVLGARLKTKLVIAFLAFSITPTLVLFVISALYINSSFDKWFSIKIQNTLQASLEITRAYYDNAESTGFHFAEHIAKTLNRRLTQGTAGLGSPGAPPLSPPWWLGEFLEGQRDLLGLDAVEYYLGAVDERVLADRPSSDDRPSYYPRLSVDVLEKAFSGTVVSITQHVGTSDLVRCAVPVKTRDGVLGVVVVNSYILVSLVNKVGEISSVFQDYRDVNPLKYPMKTTYLIILVMITLVIIFVAIWVGLYMARELTVPVERLVQGAQAVGAGNLDISISGAGNDEIAVLVESFNRMTLDLRENRRKLVQASADLEKRRLQLEAVLTHVGTGVIVVDATGEISTFNRAAASLLNIPAAVALGRLAADALPPECGALLDAIASARETLGERKTLEIPPAVQWTMKVQGETRSFTAVLTPLRELPRDAASGVVVVIDDLTHLVKGQREMAWREVARRIAHEIKNPLTPIKLSAQRLQRRFADLRGKDAAILKECTDTIVTHTDELKEMVNEFSNFARFPEISPEPNDLHDVLREVVALYTQAHSVVFDLRGDPALPIFDFDRDQLKRVVINLVENAIAALQGASTHARKSVMIETHYNPSLQICLLTLEDNGPGMNEDVRSRAFEPYFSTKSEGTGLGLAIAKRIVNDHDGYIRVESALGSGTKFFIEIPTRSRQKIGRRPVEES